MTRTLRYEQLFDLPAEVQVHAGMQADAYWQLDSPNGQEFTGSGFSATLHDYARFAGFVLGDGLLDAGGANETRVLPDGWVAMSSAVEPGSNLAPGRLPGFEPLGYGFQWWTHAAWPKPVHDASRLESYAFFKAVTRALEARR